MADAIANSIQVKVTDSRIRQYGIGRDEVIEGLEICIEASEATLQRFSIEHLNKEMNVSLGGEIIAEMTLRQVLSPGPIETHTWRHIGSDDPAHLAQRLRHEGTPLVFSLKQCVLLGSDSGRRRA